MRDFFYGKMRKFRVQSDAGVFTIAGRSYTFGDGNLTIWDGWTKVSTFMDFKNITEV